MKPSFSSKISRISHWSPIWIIPILTAFIGLWVIVTNVTNQGRTLTLITSNADGIAAGKTTIKNRSVDVGVIESVTLSNDFSQVILRAKMNKEMDELLKEDTVFWVVKPNVGREGVTGLTTLLSGAYIEVLPGKGKITDSMDYHLLDKPPITSPNTPGIRLNITSRLTGMMDAGSPVMFRGNRVGSIEQATFDPVARLTSYEVFIPKPYDILVTQNVRFWQKSGVNIDMSTRGVNVTMPSLDTLIGGSINFDVYEGAELGEQAKNFEVFTLYQDRDSAEKFSYAEYKEFLLFFTESIGGLSVGAPVEFRGIRLGTVSDVPFFNPELLDLVDFDYSIPVLIRIEKGRLDQFSARGFDFVNSALDAKNNHIYAVLKTSNVITGRTYIDLNFYPNVDTKASSAMPKQIANYTVMPTLPSGLMQIQEKIMNTLDNINRLPLDNTLAEIEKTFKETQVLIRSMNKTVNAVDTKQLRGDIREMTSSITATLKEMQPGSEMHDSLTSSIQRLEQMMRSLQPLLSTLNDKSNALVFEAPKGKDPQPKAKQKGNK